jgi:hypothetical protein
MGIFKLMGWATLILTTGCGSSVAFDDVGKPTGPRPETETEPATTLCAAVTADAPLLTLVTAEGVSIMRADGSTVLLDAGMSEFPADAQNYVNVKGRGKYLATVARSVVLGNGGSVFGITTLYDDTGKQLWRIDGEGYELTNYGVSDSGQLLVYRSDMDATSTQYAVIANGVVQLLPSELSHYGGWVADGVLRANADGQPAWYEVATGVTTIAPNALAAVRHMVWKDGYILLHPGMTVPWLFLESLGSSEMVILWDIDEPAEALRFRGATDDHVLLSSDESGRLWRVSLPFGETVELDTVTPMGGLPEDMSYCTPEPMLTSNGEALLVGGEDALWFQTVDPGSDTWTTLGQPVSQVEMVHTRERDGTFVLSGVVSTYCPGPFGSGATGIAGESLQVVRPSIGVQHVMDDGTSASVRQGGECVVYYADDGAHILDLPQGNDSKLPDGSYDWWVSHPAR